MRSLVLLTALTTAACVQYPAAQEPEDAPPRDDNPVRLAETDGMWVFKDPETGCEYLVLYQDGIVPRYESVSPGSVPRVKGCR